MKIPKSFTIRTMNTFACSINSGFAGNPPSLMQSPRAHGLQNMSDSYKLTNSLK